MPNASDIQRSWQIVATGLLPGWAAVCLLAPLATLLCLLLYWELRRLRPLGKLAAVIMLLRVMVAALVLFLLCQPLLVVASRWSVKPELMLLVNQRQSMQVREDYGQLHSKLDVLELLDRTIPARQSAASRLARALGPLADLLATTHRDLRAELDQLSTGMPPGPGFNALFTGLAKPLEAGREELGRQARFLPRTLDDDAVAAQAARFEKQLQLFLAGCRELPGQAELARVEGPAHHDLLEEFLARLGALAADARRAATLAQDLQAALDRALIPAAALSQLRARSVSRREFAELAANRVAAAVAEQMTVSRADYATVGDGARQALERQLASPLAGVVYFDDGSADLAAPERELIATLASAGVAAHSVAIGADGVEPADVGLIAVDLPTIGVVGEPIDGRALTKMRLANEQQAFLTIRQEKTVLARLPLQAGAASPLALPLRFDSPGRRQLVLEVQGESPDAFPGNERRVATIDVFPEQPQVLILSDGLRRDLALFRGVAAHMPHVQASTIVANSNMQGLELGKEPGEFPATPEDWRRVQLLVLLGNVPAAVTDNVMAALNQAIGNGLHVLVHASHGPNSWAAALDLAGQAADGPTQLMPRANMWLPLYALGQDEPAARAAWDAMPALPPATTPTTPGIALTAGGKLAALQAYQRGQGLIVRSGLSALAPWRDTGQTATVNRFVAALLELSLRPWRHGPDGPVLFPAQPVAGKLLLVAGAGEPSNVEGAETVGNGLWRVTDPRRLALTVGGRTVSLAVHELPNPDDFELAARAAPPRELARIGGGVSVDLLDLPKLIAKLDAAPAQRFRTRTYRLWAGWWPLALMLVLVSAEYLLRRRAGRVM